MSLKSNQNNYGFDQSDDSEEEIEAPKPPVVKHTKITDTIGSVKRTVNKEIDEYDFEEHTTKRTKMQVIFKRRAYNHKWGTDEDDDSYSNSQSSNGSDSTACSSSFANRSRVIERTNTLVKSDIRAVRKAKQCLDEGELKDFQDDLDYFMESLENTSMNLKCLSMIKLTKRSVAFEFRNFLRTKPAIFQKLLVYLKDCHESHALSICVSAFFYMLSRDVGQFPAQIVPLKLLLEFFKQDKPSTDSDFKIYQPQVWEIIQEWKRDCEKRKQCSITFDLNEHNLSAGNLALVTMDYVLAKSPGKNKRIQSDLLNLGFLQMLVVKIDKAVLSLKLLRTPTEEILLQNLIELEHAFRITENGIMLDKKNQSFVVGHRNGILLFSCEKYLDYFCQEIPKYESGSVISRKLFDVLDLMFRLAMNASHANDVCSMKLGQIGNFLSNSVMTICNFIPRFIEKERYVDFNLLILGLLVNLTEKTANNRRKVCNLKLKVYKLEDDKAIEESEEQQTLNFLTHLFVKHENMARTIDEELDNDLLEEAPDGDSGAEDEDNERLQRPNDMKEDEIMNALNSAMKKATAHMQDSMMSSYIGLLIGCLVQTDEVLADKVRTIVPSHNFSGIIEQLERFKEFAELTKIVDLSCITNVIQSLRIVDGSSN